MKALLFILTISVAACAQPLGPEDISRSDPGVTHGNVEYADRENP